MLKSEQTRQLKADNRKKIDAYLAQKGEAEGWDPKADADYQKLLAEDTRLQSVAAAFEESEKAERAAPAVAAKPGDGSRVTDIRLRAENDPARGFHNHREFLTSVLENTDAKTRADVSDERLRPLAVFDKDDKKSAGELAYVLPSAFTPRSLKATAGSDEQSTFDDRYGGFGVQKSRIPGLLEVGWEGDPTAGRTQAVPMQTPTVEIMARTDKNHTSSVSGGFTVARKAEAAAAAASRGQLEMVTMKAASLFGFGYSTNELMDDSPATFIALVDTGFRTQFPAAVLNEKIRGVGGDQFDGVVNTAACTVSQAKETGQGAATIIYNNVIKMASRCWGFGNAIWLANHDARPQLSVLAVPIGTAGALIYQPSPSVGLPDMLLGKPIFYSEFCATLGTVGDLILGNWSQYLEGLYQPLQSDESVHLRFDRHETAFKFWLRNAGAPWWRSALTPNQSSTTLSPFVTLATRS